MPKLEGFYQWADEHNRLQDIREYDDLTTEFNIIKARVLANHRLRNADDLALKNNIILHYRRINDSGCNRLNNRIEHRRTRGQSFFDIIQRINEIKSENERNSDLEKCQDIWNELMLISGRVDEKISIEKYTLWLFFAGLIIGLISGIIETKLKYGITNLN